MKQHLYGYRQNCMMENSMQKLELTDNVPEDTVAYAVYSDPQNGSIYRVKLTEGKKETYLKNTVIFQCSNVTSSIGFEIEKTELFCNM